MQIKSLSIRHYSLSFILLYVVFFIISSYIAFSDIDAVNEKISKTHYNNGHKELIDALDVLVLRQKTIATEFASWDEVHQQISNPKYYVYWQTHRLYKADILPDNIVEASVYNSKGKVLNQMTGATLPVQIDIDSLEPYFNIENNIPYLITSEKIPDRDQEDKFQGYVLTKSKVLSELLLTKQFNFVEGNSIKAYFLEKKNISSDELINYLKFEIKPNEEINLFSDQLKQSLTRNSLLLVGFALVFYLLLNTFLAYPLSRLSGYIDRLNNNPEFQKIPELELKLHIRELEKVKSSLMQYQSKLQTVYTNLDDKNKELWELAHHDALTGTLNRRAFEEQWRNVASLYEESRCHVSLILFDVNHFKSINDSYGHPVGDEVLKRIAQALEKTLRKGEKLYRIGGDEFATIIHNCVPDEAIHVAERCRDSISKISFTELGISEPIRSSIGVAHNTPDKPGSSISDLLWQADTAVYSAKRPGQSHVVTYSSEIKKLSKSIFSSQINSIVFDAIEDGESIQMFYQPIVNLEDDKIDYYEALLRIKTSSNEIIPPAEVFDLIESRRLEYEMDIAIFNQIAHDFTTAKIPRGTGVSINISGPSIINREIIEKLSLFVPYLGNYKIILEITETSLITHISQAAQHINKLKDMGFKIALDDFGSGYSSLSYLSTMPVDIVKFDISLIRQLEDDKQYSIIKHLTAMIQETGHLLVAEGIETSTIREKIKILGFNYGQGYFFGKPSSEIQTSLKSAVAVK